MKHIIKVEHYKFNTEINPYKILHSSNNIILYRCYV